MTDFNSNGVFNVNATPEKEKQVIPIEELGNVGLVYIADVRVDEVEYKPVNDKGVVSKNEYVGLTGGRFTVEFRSVPFANNMENRVIYMNEMAVVSTKKDGSKIEDKTLVSLYTALWNKLLHIYKSHKDLPNYQPLPDLPADAIPNPNMPVNERCDAFTKLFQHVVKHMKVGKDGINPIYYIDGKAVPAYLKVVAQGRRYAVPNNVGTGFYEVVKYDGDSMIPTKLELAANETLELTNGVESKEEIATKGFAANVAANIPKQDTSSILNKFKKPAQ